MAPGAFGKLWDKIKSGAQSIGRFVGNAGNRIADVAQNLGFNRAAGVIRNAGNGINNLAQGNVREGLQNGLAAIAGIAGGGNNG